MGKYLWPAALVLIVGFGMAEGMWTNRWSLSEGPEQASAKLAAIPKNVGDWEGQDQELGARQIARAEITGHVMRQYTHKGTGAILQVLLVCGRSGPTALHPPDICYAGAGFSKAGPLAAEVFEGTGLQVAPGFWRGRFVKPGPEPESLRICWAWNATGAWKASENPRWEFAKNRYLYKLYVVRPLSKADEPLADDPTPEFMRLFLPEVQKCLFGEPQAGPATRANITGASVGGES
jgi:Protein of unknown function (DUF3485)